MLRSALARLAAGYREVLWCLMRYKDCTFRDAEVRLAEHLDEAAITHAWQEVVHWTVLPSFRRRANVAVDATRPPKAP